MNVRALLIYQIIQWRLNKPERVFGRDGNFMEFELRCFFDTCNAKMGQSLSSLQKSEFLKLIIELTKSKFSWEKWKSEKIEKWYIEAWKKWKSCKTICRSTEGYCFLWVELTKRIFFEKAKKWKSWKKICRSTSADAYSRLKSTKSRKRKKRWAF